MQELVPPYQNGTVHKEQRCWKYLHKSTHKNNDTNNEKGALCDTKAFNAVVRFQRVSPCNRVRWVTQCNLQIYNAEITAQQRKQH